MMPRVPRDRWWAAALLSVFLVTAIPPEAGARPSAGEGEAAEIEARFGKPFAAFDDRDYARFLAGLDLTRTEDLRRWSSVTRIPLVVVTQRLEFFRANAHLLTDEAAASALSRAELEELTSSFSRTTRRLAIRDGDGKELPIGSVGSTAIRVLDLVGQVRHNAGFAEDRTVLEALEPYRARLEDVPDLPAVVEAIRALPRSVVQVLRGKAIYPTVLSRTGWAVTWRVSNDRTISYVGMIPGSSVEPRRDPRRSSLPPATLVAHGVQSLHGSAADSLVHEVGHIIDHSVIGGRPGAYAFPDQFPEYQKLLVEKERVFGAGDSRVPRTAHGYVSSYAKVNAQENFAESFWAFLRDREAFLKRARAEASEGHPELMRKFRFLERLVDHTPATSARLSRAFLEEKAKEKVRAEAARWGDPEEILREYRAARARKPAAVAAIEKSFGKPFHRFTEKDYDRFMKGLDLDQDDDLRTWSHVTDIPLLAVRKNSGFFYVNFHLLKDTRQAERLRRTRIKTEYDPESGALTVRTDGGDPLEIRDLPPGIIHPTGRTGRTWYLEDFGEDRIVLEALGPYLVRLRDHPDRGAMGSWIRTLPLSVVQIFRGKGIYFTTQTGRSYAVGMPCSNAVYKIFVGLQTGAFVDRRRDGPAGTRQNFVHEIGHLVDYAVLLGEYGSYRHPHQFPEFRKLLPEKEIVFGRGDDKVPQTPYGYVSRYARTNAQESFAEHFRAFVLEREKLLALAKKEVAAGHPELMEKFGFMERLLERTPTSMHRLSPEFLVEEERWTELSKRLARVLRARREPGAEAPDSLARVLDGLLASAFRGRPANATEERSYRKALDAAVRDAARIRDRGQSSRVLAALLGVTLDLRFDRKATGGRPDVVVTVRGADEGEVTGSVALDSRPGPRAGTAKPTKIALAAGKTLEIPSRPDLGEHAGPFVARAVANLRWGKHRLVLEKEIAGRPSIPLWAVIGPFDNPGGAAADLKHPPEMEPVDLNKTYPGAGGGVLSWRKIRRDPESKIDAEFLVDLDRCLGGGTNAAAYLFVRVLSSRAADAFLGFGSADGAVVWLNGERAGERLKGRRNDRSRSNRVPVRLKKGRNEILVKVTVTGNGWRFGAHLTDEDGRPLEGVRYNLSR